MEARARVLVVLFLGTLAIPLALMLTALWLYDPLQLFHAAWGRAPTVHANLRLQSAGVIRHRQFSSVILGTSIFENMSASEAGNRLPGDFVNLSLTASDFFERARILDALFRRKRLETVIYSLDSVYMNTRRGYPIFPYETFEFLYDQNPLNDFRAYLNGHFMACLLKWSIEPECVGRPVSMDRPNAWMADEEEMRRFGGVEKWCDANNNYQVKNTLERLREAVQGIENKAVLELPEGEIEQRIAGALRYVDEYVLQRVRENPDTEFYLVFPPYFRALTAIWYQYRLVNGRIYAAVIRQLADASEVMPNLHVFGFDNEAFVDDIANYKDLTHYHPKFDLVLLDALANGRGSIRAINADAYIAIVGEKSRAFDLRGLLRSLDSCGQAAVEAGYD